MPSLILDAVGKRFGGIEAVSDLNLEVPTSTITGLIGPNGAGKTTVVNLVTGMLRLSAGSIRLGDHDLTHEQPHRIARLGVSRTFQNVRLLADTSVLDNVAIGFHRHETATMLQALLGLPRAVAETASLRDRAWSLLRRFSMERFAHHLAGSLAYGHQRRVEMMRAVASEPVILLLDEPVAGMNDVEAGELGEIFQDLAAGGMGLLLIEHNIRFVAKLCSSVQVLDSGRTIAQGPADRVMRDPAVVAAYLGAS